MGTTLPLPLQLGVEYREVLVKRLFLLRHTKSSWNDPTLADFDRPLNKRGRRTSVLIARYLRKVEIAPELVLCSPAKRTLQTLDALRPVWDDSVEIAFVDDLYEATAERLRANLRDYAGKFTSIMMIGHNPGLQGLLLSLSSNRCSPHYLAAQRKFPTGGLAVLSASRSAWKNMSDGSFSFLEFVRPRDLESPE